LSNQFAAKPELDSDFPHVARLWTCPLTGLSVPKDPDANLQWRADMLTAAEGDEEIQQDLYTACSQSILFFINAFCFTLRVFEPGEDGTLQQAAHKHIPYVTWEIQDKHLLRLEHSIDEGSSLLTDKSRDMGATWNHIAEYVHRFLFRKDESHLMISRNEDVVDILDGLPKNYPHGTLADPGTLFGKIDYILSRLPEWMLPRMNRKRMHLVNLDSGTRIDGESSNANAGSSDRRTSIFLDEMAKMKEGDAIWRSTADVTACRLPCSTPNGAGTMFSKTRMSGRIPVFILAWWDHPEKGRNRYVQEDDLGRFKIRSPWYDAECEKRSPKEMAIEIDMDHVGSGELFFESNVLEEHRKLHVKEPKRSIAVNFKKTLADPGVQEALRRRNVKALQVSPNGPLKLWVNLINGRLDQNRTYTVACDISMGQGASNSTISILCNETQEKVGAYADANTPPHEFAKVACAVCLWVGGRSRPLLIWENNGNPGFDFGRLVVHVYNYGNIYFDRVVGTLAEKAGKRYGWRSSPEKKATALGLLRRAYSAGKFINRDEKAIDEALTYVQYDGGGIGPASLQEESESARKTHGDRVIADMLCIVGRGGMPRGRGKETVAPKRSMAARFKAWMRAKKESKNTDRFDFRGV
jgi:hypothetical protein